MRWRPRLNAADIARASGLAVVIMVCSPPLVWSQEQLRLAAPVSQSEVVPGERVSIEGTGCEPGLPVAASANDGALSPTTAGPDGSFEWAPRLSVDLLGRASAGERESGEVSLVVSCGAAEATVVLAASGPGGTDGRSAGHTALLIAESLGPPLMTAVLVIRSWRRRSS